MGMFNTLFYQNTCPRCKQQFLLEAQFYTGYLYLYNYRIGDKIVWSDNITKTNKGKRPPDGSIVGEGYVECELCQKDFFIFITIKQDIIKKVDIDYQQQGYL